MVPLRLLPALLCLLAGFVPRAQHHFAKTYGEICRQAWLEFAPQQELGGRGQGQARKVTEAPQLESRVSGRQDSWEPWGEGGDWGLREHLLEKDWIPKGERFVAHLPFPEEAWGRKRDKKGHSLSSDAPPPTCANEGFPSPPHPSTEAPQLGHGLRRGAQG